ncbi:MAG: hypothetical protein MPK30_09255 [Gammaproteobacteria bacterium]|nr:hypothetical protein [Gammaproteobacteria bacterium]
MSPQNKHGVIDRLDKLLASLRASRRSIRQSADTHVHRRAQLRLRSAAIEWFDKRRDMDKMGIDGDLLRACDTEFVNLAKIAQTETMKEACLDVVNKTIQVLENDVMVAVIMCPTTSGVMDGLNEILSGVDLSSHLDLATAVENAHAGSYHVAVIYGWNAAISHLRSAVEGMGLDVLSRICTEMVGKGGRYKRFKRYDINSHAALQGISDKDLLQVAEYAGMIDKSQHDRLGYHLIIRNGVAHPGAAIVTAENVLSFFSDITSIVFALPLGGRGPPRT